MDGGRPSTTAPPLSSSGLLNAALLLPELKVNVAVRVPYRRTRTTMYVFIARLVAGFSTRTRACGFYGTAR